MSDLGYQNSAQEALHISYRSLEDYVSTLGEAMRHSYQPYDDIGVKKNGEYCQPKYQCLANRERVLQ